MSALYGWFSHQAAVLGGSSLYERPDGHVVEVTFVGQLDSTYAWPDAVQRGEVTRWLGRGKAGWWDRDDHGWRPTHLWDWEALKQDPDAQLAPTEPEQEELEPVIQLPSWKR